MNISRKHADTVLVQWRAAMDVHRDNFHYMKGKVDGLTEYLGMISPAAEVDEDDGETRPVVAAVGSADSAPEHSAKRAAGKSR